MYRQRIFTNTNINLLTISSYTEVYGKGTKRILFYRKDINQRILFESDNVDCLSKFIECLECGIQQDELINKLAEMEIPASQGLKWIELCIEKGVIE